MKVQRDFGNRADRKVARMKYLIHNWGLRAVQAKVEEYYGDPLAPPQPVDVTELDDRMGWHAQGDGKWFYGLNVENGRIKDEGDVPAEDGAARNLPHARAAAAAHAASEHPVLRPRRNRTGRG